LKLDRANQPCSPMILTTRDNMAHGFDSAADNRLKIELDKRQICGWNDRKGAVNFKCTDKRWLAVNDQIPNPWTNTRDDGTMAPAMPSQIQAIAA